MPTIQDLRAEIEKEKKKALYNQEIEAHGKERAKLEQELKELRFKNKYGKQQETVKKVWSGLKKGFGELQKGVAKMQANQNQQDKRRRGIFG